jgi:1,4-alpha-glucan branching enzyme
MSSISLADAAAAERRKGETVIKTTKPGRDGTVRVTFALPAEAPSGAVSVVGDFNDWNPYAHPLRKRANRTRSAAVTVKTGSTLHFRYLAEGGLWFDDDSVSASSHGAIITV